MRDDGTGIVISNDNPLAALKGDGPLVIGQLGQSLDGRIATPTGHSKYINHKCGLHHLHALRAAVQAVVVGVGTVNDDDPLLTVRHCAGPSPDRVIIDPNGRVFENSKIFSDKGPRNIIITGDDTDHPLKGNPNVEMMNLKSENGRINPLDIITALSKRGLDRVLIEGGSRTLSAFIDAGCVDRLHLIVAPILLGCGFQGLSLSAVKEVGASLEPTVTLYDLGHDILFDCEFKKVHS